MKDNARRSRGCRSAAVGFPRRRSACSGIKCDALERIRSPVQRERRVLTMPANKTGLHVASMSRVDFGKGCNSLIFLVVI
jgi:hypothetical protein